MNYLQYIAAQQSFENLHYLVSGTDIAVHEIISHHIIETAYCRKKILFIIDNTQNSCFVSAGNYSVVDVFSDSVNLCKDLFEVSSLKNISRLRMLLSELGFDSVKSMKVIQYLIFVKETEHRLGNDAPLSIDKLDEYSGTMLVKWKLKELVNRGQLNTENYEYLIGRYAEISAAAADFEHFLILIAPFIGTCFPKEGMAVHLPLAAFRQDSVMQELMINFFISYVRQNPNSTVTLILDDGNSDSHHLIHILKNLPQTEIHMFTKDAFAFDDTSLSILLNQFPLKIYTRHDNMSSCSKIETFCGQIDVVKKSFTTTIDKRFKSNSAWDMLLGTNRTETEIYNASSKEYRFRKEMINSLGNKMGIIDYMGNKILFLFESR